MFVDAHQLHATVSPACDDPNALNCSIGPVQRVALHPLRAEAPAIRVHADEFNRFPNQALLSRLKALDLGYERRSYERAFRQRRHPDPTNLA
jgi:hypothetical protein